MFISLTKKIAVAAFLTLAVTLTIMILILLTAESRREKHGAIDRAHGTTQMIVEALVFAMREGVTDVAPFEKTAATIGNIRQLRVIPTELIDRKKASTMDDFERLTFGDAEEVDHLEVYMGESVLRSARLIRSDNSCIDCHGGKVGDPIVVISIRSSLEESHAAISAQRMRAIILGGITLIVTILLLYQLVNRKIVAAIRSCVEYAGKLARGDLREPLALSAHDETGQLANSFNTLRNRLLEKEDAAIRIAGGDLEQDPPVASSEDSLGFALRKSVNSLRAMQIALDSTTAHLTEGQLDARCDPGQLAGTYAHLVQGLNDAIDAVVQPMMIALECVREYSGGNLERMMPDLPGQQQIITDGLNSIRGNLRNLVKEATRLSAAAQDGELNTRGDALKFEGAYRNVIEGMNLTLENLLAPVRETVSVLEKMAANDLSQQVSGDYKGDHTVSKSALNHVLATLNELLTNIREAVDQVRTGADQVASTSQSLSEGTTRQAAALQQISSSMQEVEQRARLNGDHASEANQLANQVRRNAEEGNTRMVRMLEAMESISQSSNEISRIIKTIDEIAFQTNLLALNAAVEAARAGAHGKGFAVVADEVRNLAQRSARAASETTQLIEGSIERSQNGGKIASETAESLRTIIDGVGKVSAVIGEISGAVGQQSDSIRMINLGLGDLDQITQSNSAIAEESAAAAEELSGQTVTLQAMIQEFRLTSDSRTNRNYLPVDEKRSERREKSLSEVRPEDVIDLDDFSSF